MKKSKKQKRKERLAKSMKRQWARQPRGFLMLIDRQPGQTLEELLIEIEKAGNIKAGETVTVFNQNEDWTFTQMESSIEN